MATERQKVVTDYMNARCTTRKFKPLEVQLIELWLKKEWRLRKQEGLVIDGKTKAGKLAINQRIANLVNKAMGLVDDPIKPEHIKIYKMCWADEYSDRTGKCSWGFKDVREKLGYDPETGQEKEV